MDVLDAAGRLPSLSLSAMLSEDTGFQGDEEEFTDEESFSSNMSDKTFDWSDEEFDTAQNSREHSGNVTPTNKVPKVNKKILKKSIFIDLKKIIISVTIQ